VTPVLQLLPPTTCSDRFGDHGCTLPKDLAPLKVQDWLKDACTPGNSHAELLVERYILYKWPLRLGGWAVGQVRSVNKDANTTVSGDRCNFVVYYDCDKCSADHNLKFSSYAKNWKSPSDSWVLLG
jgi:hypothetical protein